MTSSIPTSRLPTAGLRVLLAVVVAAVLPPLVTAAPQRVGCVWERHADSAFGRFEGGTITVDGRLYCFGGFFTSQILATSRVDSYDPPTDTWTRRADMPAPTTHVGFLLEGRDVWAIGGFIGDNPGVATDDVWVYDVDLDSWSPGPALPRPIASGGVALLDRELHYFGGCEADRNTMTGDHWVLDLDAQQLGWQARAPLPEPRCQLSGARLGAEVLAVGGQIGHDISPFDTRWVHAYDPVADTWRAGPLLPTPLSHTEPGTFVRGGRLYIAGARDLGPGPSTPHGMLEYDPLLEQWNVMPPLPHRLHGANVTLIGDRIYVANGASRYNVTESVVYSRDWSTAFPDPLRINCGGPEVVTATGGCWCGDIGHMNGVSTGFNPNSNVSNTEDDVIFDRQRQGEFPNRRVVDYHLPLGDGQFRVTFFLAERATQAAGTRVFDVLIEGVRVVEDLDLALDPGFQVAVERSFDIEVLDGALSIRLLAQSGQRPLIAGLVVQRLGPDHFTYECVSAPNSTGQSATIGFIGSTSLAADGLTLHAGPVPAGTFGLFIQAEQAAAIGLPGGTLCVQPPLFRLPIEAAIGGVLRHGLSLSHPPTAAQQIAAGSTWRFQGWFRDAAVPAGYGLSDAVKLTFTL